MKNSMLCLLSVNLGKLQLAELNGYRLVELQLSEVLRLC